MRIRSVALWGVDANYRYGRILDIRNRLAKIGKWEMENLAVRGNYAQRHLLSIY